MIISALRLVRGHLGTREMPLLIYSSINIADGPIVYKLSRLFWKMPRVFSRNGRVHLAQFMAMYVYLDLYVIVLLS